MSLQDIDAMPTAVREVARVLKTGGRFCWRFETTPEDAPFLIKGDYLRALEYAAQSSATWQ